ncbi:MAG: alanine--glyoxylate aminotransferase family protein [Candidatus Bathyarchaeia archaeon]
MKLFTVGPVACYPEVLEEMGRQMLSHRSAEYRQLQRETVDGMKRFLETDSQVFLFPSSGTGFMEASVRNCVRRRMLCCVNGAFGKRYVEVGRSNGKEVLTLEAELGQPIQPDSLDDLLARNPDVEAVTVTYNETSVGLLNPLPELSEVVKKHGKLLFVDAVSAMGGVEIKVDRWGIDVCFGSSQKCFGLPPGLAMGSVSEEALKLSEKAENKGWYFDFKLFEKYQLKEWSTPMTPAIPQIYALRRILKMIEERGGKEAQFRLYKERSARIREGVEKIGFTLFPKEGYESPTVTCVNAASNPSGPEIYEMMRNEGFELAKGYGAVKDRTFRIGNMGYIPIEDVESMLATLKRVIEAYRRKSEGSPRNPA